MLLFNLNQPLPSTWCSSLLRLSLPGGGGLHRLRACAVLALLACVAWSASSQRTWSITFSLSLSLLSYIRSRVGA